MILEADGSRDGQYDISKYGNLSIPNTKVESGKNLTIVCATAAHNVLANSNMSIFQTIPSEDEPQLEIGPIYPNDTSSQIYVAVGATKVDVSAFLLGLLPVPASVNCPANNPLDYLAFTTVGGE